MADPRSHDELQRVWDAVLRGEPAAAGDLDPGLTETIRRLRACDRVPPLDPAFVRRLREDLMQGHGFASTIDLGRDATVHPNGRAEPPPRPRPAVRLGGPRHRRALARTSALVNTARSRSPSEAESAADGRAGVRGVAPGRQTSPGRAIGSS